MYWAHLNFGRPRAAKINSREGLGSAFNPDQDNFPDRVGDLVYVIDKVCFLKNETEENYLLTVFTTFWQGPEPVRRKRGDMAFAGPKIEFSDDGKATVRGKITKLLNETSNILGKIHLPFGNSSMFRKYWGSSHCLFVD